MAKLVEGRREGESRDVCEMSMDGLWITVGRDRNTEGHLPCRAWVDLIGRH